MNDKALPLQILMLLSALESWSFSTGKPLPDYLHDDLSAVIDVLKQQILDGE